MSMTVHNYRPRQFHRTSNGENLSSGYRDMGSASLAADRPPARPPGPWRQYPSSPGKNGFAMEHIHNWKTIHRSGVAVLHCPGCVWTLNPRCLESYTSTRLWLLPITGVAKNLGSSDQLSSLAGGEACNWRCLTMNQTTVHETQLADMAPATPIHGNGLQLSPCGICSSKTPFIIFS